MQYNNRTVFDQVLEKHLDRILDALGTGSPNAYNAVVALESFVHPYVIKDSGFQDRWDKLNAEYIAAEKETIKPNSKLVDYGQHSNKLKLAMELFRELNTSLKNQNLHPASQDFDDELI